MIESSTSISSRVGNSEVFLRTFLAVCYTLNTWFSYNFIHFKQTTQFFLSTMYFSTDFLVIWGLFFSLSWSTATPAWFILTSSYVILATFSVFSSTSISRNFQANSDFSSVQKSKNFTFLKFYTSQHLFVFDQLF